MATRLLPEGVPDLRPEGVDRGRGPPGARRGRLLDHARHGQPADSPERREASPFDDPVASRVRHRAHEQRRVQPLARAQVDQGADDPTALPLEEDRVPGVNDERLVPHGGGGPQDRVAEPPGATVLRLALEAELDAKVRERSVEPCGLPHPLRVVGVPAQERRIDAEVRSHVAQVLRSDDEDEVRDPRAHEGLEDEVGDRLEDRVSATVARGGEEREELLADETRPRQHPAPVAREGDDPAHRATSLRSMGEVREGSAPGSRASRGCPLGASRSRAGRRAAWPRGARGSVGGW